MAERIAAGELLGISNSDGGSSIGTQQCVDADGWILTIKMAFFVNLGFIRFWERVSSHPPVTNAHRSPA